MGTLYIVATPIGNLGDITFRAIEILNSANLVACEDTRRTAILLSKYEIKKPLVSYHQHSKITKIDYLISELKSGKNIALVTDAGTPGIADPGGVLIREALENAIVVAPIPGPSAVTAILSVAGVNTDKFLFLGYLPKKKGRETLFKKFKDYDYPIVIYESPERIIKTLNEIKDKWSDCQVIVGRELTKKFEEIYRGRISEIITKIRPQGEFVLCLKNESPSNSQE